MIFNKWNMNSNSTKFCTNYRAGEFTFRLKFRWVLSGANVLINHFINQMRYALIWISIRVSQMRTTLIIFLLIVVSFLADIYGTQWPFFRSKMINYA